MRRARTDRVRVVHCPIRLSNARFRRSRWLLIARRRELPGHVVQALLCVHAQLAARLPYLRLLRHC